jgi:hypothetical protein
MSYTPGINTPRTRTPVSSYKPSVPGDPNAVGSGSNPSVAITAPPTGQYTVIDQIDYSFSGAPTGGGLTVKNSAGQTLFAIDVTAAGPGTKDFNPALRADTTADTLTVALTGTTGKLNVRARYEE